MVADVGSSSALGALPSEGEGSVERFRSLGLRLWSLSAPLGGHYLQAMRTFDIALFLDLYFVPLDSDLLSKYIGDYA